MTGRSLSRRGGVFIAAREAIVLASYQDGEHMSIGMGHNDRGLRPGDTITVKRAFELFREDVVLREGIVRGYLKTEVAQHEFDALFSLYYQGGTDGLAAVSEFVNADDRLGTAHEFLRWDTNARGVHLDGLLKRRAREACLFLTGEYGDLSHVPIFRGPPSGPRKVQMEMYEVQVGDI